MKTEVSIPDPVFDAAEHAASELSLSRSELYTRAIEHYLASTAASDVTKNLNRVYDRQPAHVDEVLTEMQRLTIEKPEW